MKPEEAKPPTAGPAPMPLSAIAAAVPVGGQQNDALGVNQYTGHDGTGRTSPQHIPKPGGQRAGIGAHPSNPFGGG